MNYNNPYSFSSIRGRSDKSERWGQTSEKENVFPMGKKSHSISETKSKTPSKTEETIKTKIQKNIETCESKKINTCKKKEIKTLFQPIIPPRQLYDTFFNNVLSFTRPYEGLPVKYIDDKGTIQLKCPDGKIYVRKKWFPLNKAINNNSFYFYFIDKKGFINTKLKDADKCVYLGHHLTVIPKLSETNEEYIQFHFTYNIFDNPKPKISSYYCSLYIKDIMDIVNNSKINRNGKLKMLKNLTCWNIDNVGFVKRQFIPKAGIKYETTFGTNYGYLPINSQSQEDLIDLTRFDVEIYKLMYSILEKGFYIEEPKGRDSASRTPLSEWQKEKLAKQHQEFYPPPPPPPPPYRSSYRPPLQSLPNQSQYSYNKWGDTTMNRSQYPNWQQEGPTNINKYYHR